MVSFSIISLFALTAAAAVETGPIKPLQGKNPSAKDLVESNESVTIDPEAATSVLPDNTDPLANKLLRCSACRACFYQMYSALIELPKRSASPGIAEKDVAMLEAMEDVVENFGYPVSDRSGSKPGEFMVHDFVRVDPRRWRTAQAGFLKEHLRDQCGRLYGDYDEHILEGVADKDDPIDLAEKLCSEEFKVCPKDLFRNDRESRKKNIEGRNGTGASGNAKAQEEEEGDEEVNSGKGEL